MNVCKNICNDLMAKRNTKDGMYDKGFKYCSACDCFFKTFETFCLCCGTHLRMHSRKKSILTKNVEGIK